MQYYAGNPMDYLFLAAGLPSVAAYEQWSRTPAMKIRLAMQVKTYSFFSAAFMVNS
jgi:hypothetical protein